MATTLTFVASPNEVRLNPAGTSVPFTATFLNGGAGVNDALIVASGISVNGAPTIIVSGFTNISGVANLTFTGFAQAEDALGFWNIVGSASGISVPLTQGSGIDAFILDPPSTLFSTEETESSDVAFSAIYNNTVTNAEGLDTEGGGALDRLGAIAGLEGQALQALNFSLRLDDISTGFLSGNTQGGAVFNVGGTTGNPSAAVIDQVALVVPQIGGVAVWTPSASDFLIIVDANGNIVDQRPLTMPQSRVPFVLYPSGSKNTFAGPYSAFVVFGDLPLPSGASFASTQPGYIPPFNLNLGLDLRGIAVRAGSQLSNTPTSTSLGSGLVPSGLSTLAQDFVSTSTRQAAIAAKL